MRSSGALDSARKKRGGFEITIGVLEGNSPIYRLKQNPCVAPHLRAYFKTPYYMSCTLSLHWAMHVHVQSVSVLLFSKLNNIFFGYFDPGNIFLDNENK